MSGVLQSIIMSSKATALPIEFINQTNNTSTTSTLTINKPTDTSNGDLMILIVSVALSSTAWTFPSGWTALVGTSSSSAPNLGVAYKIASNEGSNYTVNSSSSSGRYAGAIVTYRNAAYDIIGTRSGTRTASSITVSNNNSVLLGLFATETTTTLGTPTGFQLITRYSGLPSYGIFSKSVNAGSTGNVSTSSDPFVASMSVLLSIKPA